ncbi:alpha/beta-hydrolase [Myriangium duriaei CBS 260.36]|uniref:Alpha/beta-hydrolase n=1 Tax=Myriangium duriaei CBS 260.36 TaxID=1168546 RepID=A0A9P4ML75_9PEZI|nr:alpha/beta-hydrolase [Myriangium duriaei CBS 260.36]
MPDSSSINSRASAVYRISRFPFPRSDNQRHAWTEGKRVCLKGLSLHKYPMSEIAVPHSHGLPSEGKSILVYAHVPPKATSSNPAPCVILMTGLDGYRTELAAWSAGFGALGVGTIVFEIPGTGDSPADPRDPTSGDRVYSSLFSWLRSAEAPPLDSARLVVWGFSTGGYHVIRAAHTHPWEAAGFVSQGGGCHHMFDAEWLDASLSLEYPFDLGSTLACKFGYHGNKGFAAFKKEARSRFSLLENGTLDRPCGRLLLVNGTGDEIFPIDDYYLVLSHGGAKEARFVDGRKHMGEPEAFFIILKWIYDRLGIDAVPMVQMKTMPFKAKYP